MVAAVGADSRGTMVTRTDSHRAKSTSAPCRKVCVDRDALIDRVRGCILGGAVGDAMGGPLEGQPGRLADCEHASWSISDDTQLTLATCEAVAAANGVCPERVAESFASWFRAGRITGVGASTLKALRELSAGQHWALAGAKGEMSAGNGAAMRVAPLAFWLNPDDEHERRTLRDVCRITHHNEEAYMGALAVVTAVRRTVFDEVACDKVLLDMRNSLPDSRVRDRIGAIAGLEGKPSILEVGLQFGASGYVVDTVPLALHALAFGQCCSLEDVLQQVIRCGGDTDTNAAIAGQLLGAALGASRIPRDLLARVSSMLDVSRIVERFVSQTVAR